MLYSMCSKETYSVIVGNKCDADFDLEKLENDKQEFNAAKMGEMGNFFELMTSAKLGLNVEKIFESILDNVALKKKEASH